MSDASAREQTDTEARRATAGLRVRVSAPSVFEHVPPPPPEARRRLAGLLVGKSFLELLLLAALVVGFSYSAFPSSVEGGLDRADVRGVSGWAVDRSRPGEKKLTTRSLEELTDGAIEYRVLPRRRGQ